jgi:hypothetical protein
MAEPQEKYALEFEGASKNLRIVVDNTTSALTKAIDPESQEEILFLFAVVTSKSDEGDAKLGDMCGLLMDAQLHYHTYDAKSGAPYRITRMGATESRLKLFGEQALHNLTPPVFS